jgi:hypothetical protein
MTYDELLAELDKRIELTHELGGCHPEQHALRSVVELHKPFNYSHHFTDKVFIYCSACKDHEYPCPTIQAIEKEAK